MSHVLPDGLINSFLVKGMQALLFTSRNNNDLVERYEVSNACQCNIFQILHDKLPILPFFFLI